MYFYGINVGEILTGVIEWALPIVLLWAAGEVAFLIHRAHTQIVSIAQAKLSAQQLAVLQSLANVVVAEVQQIKQRPDVQMAATAAKTLAVSKFVTYANEHGIGVTTAFANSLIEDAYRAMVNWEGATAVVNVAPSAAPVEVQQPAA